MRVSESLRNSTWRNPALRRGVTTMPAKCVRSDSSCEAEATSFCELSACSWPSSWLISMEASGLTVNSVSTNTR